MSDVSQTPVPAAEKSKRFFTVRRLAIAGVVAGVTALGVGAVMSQPHGWGGWGRGPGYGQGYGPGQGDSGGQGYGPGQGMMGPQGGMGPHGGPGMMGRGGMFGFGPLARIDDALSSVGATAEQKQKIFKIGREAMMELMPLRERGYVARTRLQELLKAPNFDRAAIEKLRADEFAAYEAGSKRAAQAISDVAEVLNPQQRQQLVERWEARRRWWRG
jgi:Spy/CpxP family protein refolding chaperone